MESLGRLPTESVPLEQAVGRVLQEPITADRFLPPFDRATVDGIAISSETLNNGQRKFKIAATLPAGSPQATLENPRTCFEIMTGAAVPYGCDCVLKLEDLDIDGETAKVNDGVYASFGQGIHKAGSDCSAGDTLLESGVTITAKEIAIMASVGKTELLVSKLPRIALVTTGDELVPIDATPEAHQIRRSNDLTLAMALASAGYTDCERLHLPDDQALIDQKLKEILEQFDCLILAGGVSKGKFDYVPIALQKLGLDKRFQWISQRPGQPMWFGMRRQASEPTPIFALPGNPVSCFTCLRRYVIPALDQWSGKPPAKAVYAKLEDDITFKQPFTLFLPVSLKPKPSGDLWAKHILFNTSGDFVSVAKTNGFVELPKGKDRFLSGEPFRYFDWPI